MGFHLRATVDEFGGELVVRMAEQAHRAGGIRRGPGLLQ